MAKNNAEKRQTQALGWKENCMLYLHDAVYLLIAVLLVFLLVFRIIIVSGDSMRMTLVDGDYLLLLNNLFYHEPKQGDVVVISKKSFDNGAPIVKRVIATEGQTVDIDFEAGIVYVDGNALSEDYINTPTSNSDGTVFPLVVEENCIFALGDNRGVSRDSRDPVIGQIDNREILGKALYLFFPGTDKDRAPRESDRIGAIK
jgi:signal peptidase I